MVLGIYGAGGLGREILDLARGINARDQTWAQIIFIRDFEGESDISGTEVLTFEQFKERFTVDSAKIVIAVGEPQARRVLREKVLAAGYGLQTLVHSQAFIGTDTELGEGVIVQYGCFISCNVKIGNNVLLQPTSNVGHDSVVGQDTVISTFVVVSGKCLIGEQSYLAIGVPVKDRITIGANTIIGMGSAVLRDVSENVIAMGIPARAIKKNEDGNIFH